jgi:membrane dipeptidase
MATGDGRATHGPWVDLHAHPGRFFLEGLRPEQRVGPFTADPEADRVHAEAEAGGMAAVAYATVADGAVLGWQGPGVLATTRDFAPGEAYADHRRQLAAAQQVVSRLGLTVMRGADDIDQAHADGRTCLLLTCEGADFAEDDLGRVAEAQEVGVRSITLVHYRQNAFGDAQTAPAVHRGLSAAGRELVREANRVGVLIDVAHATFETTLAVLEESSQPVMLSHTHLRGGRRDHPRLVSPAHASAVAAGGGVIGVWPSGFSSETFDDFVDEITRLTDTVGVDHVGIGTDMDGNYEPVLASYREFAAIGTGLASRGLTDVDIDKVLGGNAVRLIRTVCG